MEILGISFSTDSNGLHKYTLHCKMPFDSYYSGEGRECVGHKVESVYVGNYDISALKVGMVIDISYEKAVNTKNGAYSPVKKIDIVGK